MDITVKKSRRRTISLSIGAGGAVVLRVPYWLRTSDINTILERKSSWIAKNVHRMQSRVPKRYKFVSGENFLFLGQNYRLWISERYFRDVQLGAAYLEISKFQESYAQSRIIDWYKREARKYLVSRLSQLAQQQGANYASIRITSPKTRWGSCSGRGTINLSWRLIMLPSWIIDYVIVHELAHLSHHHHQHSFWVEVSRHFPEWERARDWLKQNGSRVPNL